MYLQPLWILGEGDTKKEEKFLLPSFSSFFSPHCPFFLWPTHHFGNDLEHCYFLYINNNTKKSQGNEFFTPINRRPL